MSACAANPAAALLMVMGGLSLTTVAAMVVWAWATTRRGDL